MLSKCHSLCCLPIAGSEQLNDKAADQPQALQTGSGGKKALRGKGGSCAEWPLPIPSALNHGKQKLNLSAQGDLGSGGPWAGTWEGCAPDGPLEARASQEEPPPLTKGVLLVGLGPRKLHPAQVTGLWPASKEARRTPSPFLHLALAAAPHVGASRPP